MKYCSLQDCGIKHYAKSYCNYHYQRMYRNNRLEILYGAPQDRFFKNVRKTDDCWVWTGAITKGGYGLFWLNGKNVYAHRYSFGLEKIPKQLQLDHLCRNRSCVNPSHLEPVTQRENMRRGWLARKKDLIWPIS